MKKSPDCWLGLVVVTPVCKIYTLCPENIVQLELNNSFAWMTTTIRKNIWMTQKLCFNVYLNPYWIADNISCIEQNHIQFKLSSLWKFWGNIYILLALFECFNFISLNLIPVWYTFLINSCCMHFHSWLFPLHISQGHVVLAFSFQLKIAHNIKPEMECNNNSHRFQASRKIKDQKAMQIQLKWLLPNA